MVEPKLFVWKDIEPLSDMEYSDGGVVFAIATDVEEARAAFVRSFIKKMGPKDRDYGPGIRSSSLLYHDILYCVEKLRSILMYMEQPPEVHGCANADFVHMA